MPSPADPLLESVIHEVTERLESARAGWDDPRRLDWTIAALARRQHGVVSSGQLSRLGVGEHAVRVRLRADRLHRLHRGVYAVGHEVLGRDGRRRAALLACGEHAALSHRSASHAHGAQLSDRDVVEVSVPTNGGRAPRNVHVHRAASLTERDVTVVKGFRCTTVARTVLDLAAVLDPGELRKVLRALDQAGRLDSRAVADAAARVARPRGIRRLRTLLLEFADTDAVPARDLARCYRRLCRRHGLFAGEPEREVLGGRRRVDFLHEPQGVAVELDGRTAHQRLAAVVDDRRRDRELAAIGILTLRLTHQDLLEPHAPTTAGQIADALRARHP